MGLRLGRIWLAAFVAACSVSVVLSASPAQAWGTSTPLPPVLSKAALSEAGVKVGGGGALKTIGQVAGSTTSPLAKLFNLATVGFALYQVGDGLIHMKQPGATAGGLGIPTTTTYTNPANDSVVTGTITNVTGNTVTYNINCSAWGAWNSTLNAFPCNGVYSTYNFGRIATSVSAPVQPGDVECVNTTSGVHTMRTFQTTLTFAGTTATTTGQAGVTGTFASGCLGTETTVGLRITPTPNEGGSRHMQVGLGWGTGVNPDFGTGPLVFQQAVVDVTCKNATTGAVQHIAYTSNWGDSETIVFPSCKQHLGSDWYGVGVKVIPMDPFVNGKEVQNWPGHDASPIPNIPEFGPTTGTPAEDAMPCRTTANGCGLSIWIGTEQITPGAGQRTRVNTALKTSPDTVKCKWGTEVVDWKYCIPVLPSLDTGTSVIDPTIDPGPNPEDPPVTEPGDSDGCLAEVSWTHPVRAIYTGAKCAIQWAFKPTTPFDVRVNRVKTAYAAKPPFSWLASLGSLPSVGGAGCPAGLEFQFHGDSFPLLCGTAMGNAVHGFRPTLVVLMLGAAVYPFVRALVYAAFPIVKPVPHD